MGLDTTGVRGTTQPRLDAALDAQVVLMQTQGLAAISQLPYGPIGTLPQAAIQYEAQLRYNALGIIG